MARRAHAYPQVSPVAADLIDGAVAVAPAGVTAGDALALARRRRVRVVRCGDGWVLSEDLGRAEALGLTALPAAELARPLPAVDAHAPELAVRRHLASGEPAVVVTERRAPLGVVARATPPPPVSMTVRFARRLAAETRALLATAGHVAESAGARAFVVGGLVRDVWLERERERRDLDVVVEGDGLLVARRLAAALGGTLVEHERFLTASVDLSAGPATGGAPLRIDVVTARAERYDVPGALPRVVPASIAQDLRRRDFTVNAMAVELASGAFGLLDPLGGAADLRRRRLRVLHPLSFVEDPTRVVRAARYAERLGLVPDAWTRRCQALGVRLAPYPALSGSRIAAELERALAEPRPEAVLRRLGSAGALRLLHPRYRWTRVTAERVRNLAETLAWAVARAVPVGGLEVLALALAGDQPAEVASAFLRGLGWSGEPHSRLVHALSVGDALQQRLAAATAPSARAAALRDSTGAGLAWLRLAGEPGTRERVDWWLDRGRAQAPTLGGEDVIALGVPRGPAVARVLAALRDARLDGKIADRTAEIDYVRGWLTRGIDHGPVARKEG